MGHLLACTNTPGIEDVTLPILAVKFPVPKTGICPLIEEGISTCGYPHCYVPGELAGQFEQGQRIFRPVFTVAQSRDATIAAIESGGVGAICGQGHELAFCIEAWLAVARAAKRNRVLCGMVSRGINLPVWGPRLLAQTDCWLTISVDAIFRADEKGYHVQQEVFTGLREIVQAPGGLDRLTVSIVVNPNAEAMSMLVLVKLAELGVANVAFNVPIRYRGKLQVVRHGLQRVRPCALRLVAFAELLGMNPKLANEIRQGEKVTDVAKFLGSRMNLTLFHSINFLTGKVAHGEGVTTVDSLWHKLALDQKGAPVLQLAA